MCLILDQNGNHVIQKVLLVFPKSKNQFLFDEITKSCLEISKLRLGVCIIQKALEMSNDIQKKLLISELVRYIDKLINDEFGNFIIQHIIKLKNEESMDKISGFISSNLVLLSKLKYASNVIDKVRVIDQVHIN
jgi:Pumilio-family RNA binding repeat